MILRARIVLPVSRPPIEDGAIRVLCERITQVARRAEFSLEPGEEEHDLGDAILLPGLINAHCHLDYSNMAGLLLPPRNFTDWIKAMVAIKSAWTVEDFAASWRAGAAMLLRSGTTTVADIEAIPELLPAAWQSTPLRVISFRELIAVKSRVAAADLVERAVNEWLDLPAGGGRVGLSPHAPYTTTPELLEAAARAAHRRSWPLVTHVAESEDEFEMFMYRQGPMFDWLKSQRDMADCGHGSPVQHLERCGYLDENLVAVHVNHLWRHDAGLLARNRVSVVHCPRSHDFFRHLKFPREELARAGVNICLGTDSLASVRTDRRRPAELSLFAEMKLMAGVAPVLAPEAILRMVTLNSARALGRAGELGELAPGALADIIAVPFTGPPADACAAVIHHEGPVSASMIAGNWVWRLESGGGIERSGSRGG